MSGREIIRILLVGGFLCLMPVAAWADCGGETRRITEDEKVLFDWVDNVFPGLIRAGDYKLGEAHMGSSGQFRCVNTPNEPYFLSTSFRLSPEGNAADAVNAGAADMSAKMQQMMDEMKQMQQRGASMEEMAARADAQNQQIEQQQNELRVQSGVKVTAYFNVKSVKCNGTATKIPHAFTACRALKKGAASLDVLFGDWIVPSEKQKGFKAAFDESAPTSRLQTVEISVVADSDTLDALISNTEWGAVSKRVGH